MATAKPSAQTSDGVLNRLKECLEEALGLLEELEERGLIGAAPNTQRVPAEVTDDDEADDDLDDDLESDEEEFDSPTVDDISVGDYVQLVEGKKSAIGKAIRKDKQRGVLLGFEDKAEQKDWGGWYTSEDLEEYQAGLVEAADDDC